MGGPVTNNGMVANSNEMRNFVAHLNKLMDNLKASMDAALKSVQEMQNAGYNDNTFKTFDNTFKEEVKFVDALNDKLKNSAKHYGVLIEMVDRHNEHHYKSQYGGQIKL